jgi:hypothetical protein
MSDNNKINDAVAERDTEKLKSLILGAEFVLLSVADEDSQEENVGALTAELEDFDVLVAFSSEKNAGDFVNEMSELFEDDEEVEGVVVEGDAMLEYLPEGFGLLIDPETEAACIVEPTLASELVSTES